MNVRHRPHEHPETSYFTPLRFPESSYDSAAFQYETASHNDGDASGYVSYLCTSITMSFRSLLAKLSTCEISDALLKLGIRNGGHIPQLQMISPNPLSLSDDSSSVICGPAYTVQMVLASDTTSPKLTAGHFVDLAPEESVIFIDAPPGWFMASYQ